MLAVAPSSAPVQKPFDVQVFNSLQHFQTAKLSVPEVTKAADALGAVIEQHGMEDSVGICLLHKHFDLKAQEVLVETQSVGESHLKPQSWTSDEALVPYMWKVTTRCEVFPLEFVQADEDKSRKTAFVLSNSAFLADLTRTILELGLEDVAGFSVLHRDHLTDIDPSTLELTNDQLRKLVVLPMSKTDRPPQDFLKSDDSETVRTMWTFRKKSDEIHECGHCWHCNHCDHYT